MRGAALRRIRDRKDIAAVQIASAIHIREQTKRRDERSSGRSFHTPRTHRRAEERREGRGENAFASRSLRMQMTLPLSPCS